MRVHAFLYYIHKFSLQHGLYQQKSKILVGVSGGEDSMALLYFFAFAAKKGWIAGVRAAYVDHQTRPQEILQEKKLINSYCHQLGLECSFLEVTGQFKSNIELELRRQRRQLLLSNLKPDEFLALGHHLDDSYEWSLRQSLRSSRLESSLGIPVKNGAVRRPLLCVSKRQIQTLCKKAKIPVLFDSSNLSLKFERNLLRQKVMTEIAINFPGYLKHYVQRQLELEALLKVRPLIIIYEKKNPSAHFIQFAPESNPLHLKREIFRLLRQFSHEERGTWGKQLEKFLIMLQSPHPKGPLSLSGGLYLYSLGRNCALLLKEPSPMKLSRLRKHYCVAADS